MPLQGDPYDEQGRWLAGLILGECDLLAADVLGRLVVLRAQAQAALDGGMLDLVRRASVARAAAQQAADVAFLQGLIDGTADYFADDLYERLEPLYAKYENDPAMLAMFNNAATVYGDAVVERAYWTMAAIAIEDAKRGDFQE